MILGQVTGEVVAPVANAHLEGQRLLLLRALDLEGELRGADLVALDRVDAGVGDRVLAIREGGSARLLTHEESIPVQVVIVAVVDGIERGEAGSPPEPGPRGAPPAGP